MFLLLLLEESNKNARLYLLSQQSSAGSSQPGEQNSVQPGRGRVTHADTVRNSCIFAERNHEFRALSEGYSTVNIRRIRLWTGSLEEFEKLLFDAGKLLIVDFCLMGPAPHILEISNQQWSVGNRQSEPFRRLGVAFG